MIIVRNVMVKEFKPRSSAFTVIFNKEYWNYAKKMSDQNVLIQPREMAELMLI